MKVYRIEHSEKFSEDVAHFIGPFRSLTELPDTGVRVYNKSQDYRCFDPSNHPPPYSDGMAASPSSEFVYGCQYLAGLMDWFPIASGREAMKEAGFTIRCYTVEVKAEYIGNMQVAFDPTLAEDSYELDIVNPEEPITWCEAV